MSQMEQNSCSSQGGLRMWQPQYHNWCQLPSHHQQLLPLFLTCSTQEKSQETSRLWTKDFRISTVNNFYCQYCLLVAPTRIYIVILCVCVCMCVCLVSPRQGLARNSLGIHLMANMENPRILKVQKKKKSLMRFPDNCKSSTFPILKILRLTEGRERRKHRPWEQEENIQLLTPWWHGALCQLLLVFFILNILKASVTKGILQGADAHPEGRLQGLPSIFPVV